MKRDRLWGNCCLLLCAMLWGSTFVAQVFGTNYVGPLWYNAVRFIVGSVALWPLIAFRAKKSGGDRLAGALPEGVRLHRTILGGIVCGLVLCVASYFQQEGMSDTTASKAGFISTLYILIVPVLRLLRGKRGPKIIWICILVAMVGMYFLCIPAGARISLGYGDMMVLVSALFYALHILSIDHFVADVDPVQLSSLQFLAAGLVAGLAGLIFEPVTAADIWDCRWPILYAGLISCGAGYTLQVIGQQGADPMRASLLLSTESVFCALSGWAVLHEHFSGRELGGCILILSAVLLAQCENALKRIRERFGGKKGNGT